MADSILEYFRLSDLEEYRRIQYRFLDVSGHLLEECRLKMKEKHPLLYKRGQLEFINSAFEDMKMYSEEPVCFMLFEILDNLPHDKIVIDTYNNLVFER